MRRLITCATVAFLLLACLPTFAEDKITLDELLQKHLDSIGSNEARLGTRVRAVNGKFKMEVIQGGNDEASGDAGVISAGKMMKLMMKTDSARYAGEKFWYDGKHVVVPVSDVAARTYIADFMYRNQPILRDGLFSGTVGTSWALLDVKDRGAKMIYDGIKTIDGQDLHQVTYVPKKSASELEIHLYFDPQTFRHVMTRYKFEVTGYLNVTPGIDRQARTQNTGKTIYRLEEKFSDFHTTDGLTLPGTWDIRYSVEPVRPILMHWTVNLTRVTSNPNVDLKAIFPE